MRITKWGEYGILCSLQLARRYQTGSVGASEIASSQGIPLQYTQQILQRLRRGGIIASVRGPKGGFTLVRSPQQTTLKDILYAAEGDTFEVVCDVHPAYEEACATKICGLRAVWRDVKTAVDAVLTERTLASIMANEVDRTMSELVPGPKSSATIAGSEHP